MTKLTLEEKIAKASETAIKKAEKDGLDAKATQDAIDTAVQKVKDADAKASETEDNVYNVESPVKGFCGIGAAGVNFAYGKAEVKEGWVLDWYRNHGYTVTKK
ncbi:MAG: hypothetical protein ACERKZ_02425 [Lachnotalea sp.]